MNATTVNVMIGNSDDKLTQREWSQFVRDIGHYIEKYSEEVHFSGFSNAGEPWQNASWTVSIKEENKELLRAALERSRGRFKQDSVAWLEGAAIFI